MGLLVPALLALMGLLCCQHVCADEIANETFAADARLFISDNVKGSPSIVVMDLPSAKVIARISVPPNTGFHKLVDGGRHLLAVRNGDWDQQYTTVISTGMDLRPTSFGTVWGRRSLLQQSAVDNGAGGNNLPKKTDGLEGPAYSSRARARGRMSRPVVAKTVVLGQGNNGITMHKSWNCYVMQAETSGDFYCIKPSSFRAVEKWDADRFTKLTPGGHYYHVQWGNNLIVSNYYGSKVMVYNRAGRAQGRGFPSRGNCTNGHGAAIFTAKGWSKSMFTCGEGILVVSSDGKDEMLAATNTSRPWTFLEGPKGRGIFFGMWAEAQVLQRIDVSQRARSTISAVATATVKPMAWVRGPRGLYLLGLGEDGKLSMYDGVSGRTLHTLQVQKAVTTKQLEETAWPGMQVHLDRVFITMPHLGQLRVVQINWAAKRLGPVLGSIHIGGIPSDITLVSRETAAMA